MDIFFASASCQACRKVAFTQIPVATDYIASKISQKIAEINLEFGMHSGLRSMVHAVGVRRRMGRALKRVRPYGGLVLLVAALLQWYGTPLATLPTMIKLPPVGKWFARLFK